MDPIPRFLPRFLPRLIRLPPQAVSVDTAGQTSSPAAAGAGAGAGPATSTDMPHGCGWFNSSHELHAGLSITEHDSPDPVAGDLALDVWLAWHLSGHSTPGRAACA